MSHCNVKLDSSSTDHGTQYWKSTHIVDINHECKVSNPQMSMHYHRIHALCLYRRIRTTFYILFNISYYITEKKIWCRDCFLFYVNLSQVFLHIIIIFYLFFGRLSLPWHWQVWGITVSALPICLSVPHYGWWSSGASYVLLKIQYLCSMAKCATCIPWTSFGFNYIPYACTTLLHVFIGSIGLQVYWYVFGEKL